MRTAKQANISPSELPEEVRPRTKPFCRRIAVVIGLVGGWIALIQSMTGLYDRFTRPKLEVLGLKPICILQELKHPEPIPDFLHHGIGVIAHVQNGNRELSVNGVDIDGRIYLTYMEYLHYLRMMENGMPLDKYFGQYEKDRPYVRINWAAGPEQGIPITLKPYEQRHICFTVLPPTPHFGIYMLFDNTQVGTSTSTHDPVPDTTPRIMYLFDMDVPSQRPTDIRREVKEGEVKFSLRVAGKSVLVPQSKIVPWKVIWKDDWDRGPAFTLYERQYGHY